MSSVVRVPLSPRVRAVLALEPDERKRAAIAAHLYEDVELSATTAGRIELFERVRLAILKLTRERPDGLERGIELAAIDWRDLLMEAGFGDQDTHIAWARSLGSE